MSDGPHKSLNMRRHWKALARRAALAAHDPAEVCEALTPALLSDAREIPLVKAKEILSVTDQSDLFNEDVAGRLERLRHECAGSSTGNAFIDSAQEAWQDGLRGESVIMRALVGAMDETRRAAFQSIEEHWRREGSVEGTAYVRDRLNNAWNAFDAKAIASEILSGASKSHANQAIKKRDGVDEGPRL